MYGVCLIVIGIDIIIIRYYYGYGGWSWWIAVNNDQIDQLLWQIILFGDPVR